MPLGKLSQRQIRSAYSVLTELLAEIKGGRSASKILDASNRFYTLIPHDFGLLKPPPLDNEVLIGTKTQMLDNLLEIEVAYSLLKQEGGGAKKDPIDAHYEKLKTDMEVKSHSHKIHVCIPIYIYILVAIYIVHQPIYVCMFVYMYSQYVLHPTCILFVFV